VQCRFFRRGFFERRQHLRNFHRSGQDHVDHLRRP
jgi:hypothetical protein